MIKFLCVRISELVGRWGGRLLVSGCSQRDKDTRSGYPIKGTVGAPTKHIRSRDSQMGPQKAPRTWLYFRVRYLASISISRRHAGDRGTGKLRGVNRDRNRFH